ncbi:sulfotransferase family protein [Pseudooctadecabacter jejudonensis]|uniref:Sulfotransferase domain protein n=1 Tax=Pseudooctadecabacter jejudonensis TaxID=1391910 RepID=A0A1Y5TEP5_9RHOB|nr:sulfotransferase [Pseudooctadecabacter jejudonensis]SLN62199.1 hypothetical protein PSJ8397_03299 [Pseudooctadecabacter jejudonensis]
MTQQPQILLVGGTPRSQTSALSVLLNTHHDMFIGMERFYFKVLRDFTLDRTDFEPPRFYELHPGDTFHESIFPDVDVTGKIDRFADLSYVGDKIPTVYEKIDEVRSAIPEARFLFIVRDVIDVAASYRDRAERNDPTWPADKDHRQGVEDWNQANRILGSLDPSLDASIILARQLFDATDKAEKLYAHLGLNPKAYNEEHVNLIYEKASSILERPVQRNFSQAALDEIAQSADFESYQKLLTSPHFVSL